MPAWISQNGGTLLVGLLVLLAAGAAVRQLLLDRRRGKSSCGSGCGGCPMADACHKKNT